MSHEHEGPPGHHHQREVRILVNGKPVVITQERVTGAQIKAAAIAQGVNIQPDFVLFEDLSNGKQVIVKDDQTVAVHNGQRFEAVTNDDNS